MFISYVIYRPIFGRKKLNRPFTKSSQEIEKDEGESSSRDSTEATSFFSKPHLKSSSEAKCSTSAELIAMIRARTAPIGKPKLPTVPTATPNEENAEE